VELANKARRKDNELRKAERINRIKNMSEEEAVHEAVNTPPSFPSGMKLPI
jgi:hypothetical protein